jgi:CRISPR system Cascade subunit CasC
MFLAQSDIDAVTEVLMTAAQKGKEFEKVPAKDLQALAISKGFRAISVDMALFGRMVTSEAIRDVDAACQVAHALSTHRVEQEFDYFTAVDDLQGKNESEGEEDSGADMIGDVEFNSACYYKYFSIDVDALVDNLVGRSILKEKVIAEDEQKARDLACKAILALIESAVRVTPTGKQNTFASHTLPNAVLIEVRPTKSPVSYANAFANPVRASMSTGGLIDQSVEQFRNHVEKITQAFNLESKKRLWFAPEHDFYPNLTPKEKPVESMETLQELLDAVKEAVCE